MTRTAVIINPSSGRGRGRGLALAQQLRDDTSIDVTLLENFAMLVPALQRMAAGNVERLFISSGDGTVHAIQTWLAENLAPERLPQLCLLPHGTTNLTAADLGFRNRNITAQADFVCRGVASEVHARPTVRVANPKKQGPVHGMFFGVGAIPEATRHAQTAFNDRGVGGNFASFATLAQALLKTVLSKPNPSDITRFDRPHDIELVADGERVCDGPQLLMLATTLSKLVLNSKPFWGGATHPLRVTTIPYPMPSLARWLLPTLFGHEHRRAAPGATSKACTHCALRCDTNFVLDGEFYALPDDEPLRIETGPAFQYLIA